MLRFLLVLAIVSRAVVAQVCLTCVPGVCQPNPSCPPVDITVTYLRHPNCGMFYKCSMGFACEMHCPAGLHWSVQLSRCEWPNIACCDPNIPCGGVPTPAPVPTTTPAPITTTAAPITTTAAPITTTEAPTTTAAPITTTAAPITTTAAPITTTAAPITTTAAPPVPTPAPPVPTPAPANCINDARCPANENPNDPTLLPHENNCNMFYKCANAQRCPMTCPAGQHFSATLRRCDWPQIACCDPSVPCQAPPPPVTTLPPPVPTIPPPVTCLADARCPVNENPNNPTLIPHEMNCIYFYKCANGERCPMQCPPGQHFSATLRRCDWPQFACCDPSVPCQAPPPPVTTVAPPVTIAPPAGPVACITDARCPVNENPNNPTVLPHENNCGQFYKCALGQRCPVSCPLGEHFSVALQRCEWPQIACCDPRVPCQGVTTLAPVPVPAPVTPSCTTDARCPANDNPANPLLLRHETDCAQFYKCANGQRCTMQCKIGEHFSVQSQRCEWPNIACCDPRVPCQSGPTTIAPVPTVASPTACHPDVGCPLRDDPANPLHLPNPSSCSSFFKCQSGEACLISCPTGQHWSRQHNRCEWPNIACCDAALCRP